MLAIHQHQAGPGSVAGTIPKKINNLVLDNKTHGMSTATLHGGTGVVEVHDQVAGQLRRPRRGGMGGGTENADPAGGVFDDGEDVQPRSGQGSGFEEVGGDDRVCLAA